MTSVTLRIATADCGAITAGCRAIARCCGDAILKPRPIRNPQMNPQSPIPNPQSE
jgi:hypothetical protein